MSPDASRRPPLPAGLAALLTFFAAACVLVLEIAAGRLLAPYVGVSLTTYTGIIGVILAGIAAGAWAGGRLADRHPPERLLGPTLLLGGVAAIASVPAVGTVGALGLGPGPVAIVLLATIGFAAPAAVLSAVGPMIVRASLVDLGSSGSLVGRLSAIGTAGAITGTWVTGFVLLGLVPTRALIIGTGVLLALVGLAVAVLLRGRVAGSLLLLLPLAAVAGVSATAADPCQRESAYFCMTVVRADDDPSRRTLVLDRVRHAAVDLDDPAYLDFRYVRWFAGVAAPVVRRTGGDLDVLHIGGGGFTVPRYLVATAPSSRHTVLELDPEVLAVNRDELGFRPTDAIDVRLGDARLGIAGAPGDAYELAIGDAFAGLSVPWHLTTREFLLEVDRALTRDGVYAMNLIDGPALRFVRAELATVRSVWEHVAVVATPATLAGATGGNIVLVASHAPLALDALGSEPDAGGQAAAVVSTPSELDRLAADAAILRDDFAPVDQLLTR